MPKELKELTANIMAAINKADADPRVTCSRCGKPTALDIPWVKPAICEPCLDAIEAATRKASAAEDFHERRKASGLPVQYHNARFADFQQHFDPRYTSHQLAAARLLHQSIAAPGRKGVLLTGPSGSGKTHLLAATANNYLMHQAVLWIDAGQLETELARTTFAREKEAVEPFGRRVSRDYSVLFIDDFTFDKSTGYDWLHNSFSRFLNDLEAHGQTRVYISTNNPLDKRPPDPVTQQPDRGDQLPSLRDIFKERGVSRLIQLATPVHLTGPNRRLPH